MYRDFNKNTFLLQNNALNTNALSIIKVMLIWIFPSQKSSIQLDT